MIRRKWKSVINNDRDRDRDTSRAKDHKTNNFEEGEYKYKKKRNKLMSEDDYRLKRSGKIVDMRRKEN